MEQKIYDSFIRILKKELMPALGCTEPIALAYASAKAREILGKMPEKLTVTCSGNIIKNVKGVVVPATGGLRGIEAAALVGAVGGDASKELEVLCSVTDEDRAKVKELLEQHICQVKISDSKAKLHIIVEMEAGEDSSLVELIHSHTEIVRMMKNGQALLKRSYSENAGDEEEEEYRFLNMENIYRFANEVNTEDVKEILDPQISYNSKIAEEGLREVYGANVGKTLVEVYGKSFEVMAKALPAAGSDARMSGCELPVIINSGSGNQGMTVSLPVIACARELGADEEKRYRALCISNLTALYQKRDIGRLSAYCGAVSAGCGSGAGIAWLYGRHKDPQALLKDVSHTIVNALAVDSGIVCDGAKASCAAKIASAVDAGILGFTMYQHGQQFRGGDGIITKGVEETIRNIGLLATQGMRETDREILDIMTTRC